MSFDPEVVLENSFNYFNDFARAGNFGQYMDTVSINRSDHSGDVISSASVGWGLVSLCIGAEKGYITQ